MLGIWYSRHLLGSGTRVATPGSPGRQGSARRVERSEPLPFREFWRRALPDRPKEMTLKRCSPTSEGEQGSGGRVVAMVSRRDEPRGEDVPVGDRRAGIVAPPLGSQLGAPEMRMPRMNDSPAVSISSGWAPQCAGAPIDRRRLSQELGERRPCSRRQHGAGRGCRTWASVLAAAGGYGLPVAVEGGRPLVAVRQGSGCEAAGHSHRNRAGVPLLP